MAFGSPWPVRTAASSNRPRLQRNLELPIHNGPSPPVLGNFLRKTNMAKAKSISSPFEQSFMFH
ncbi:MAG: hypothetical protein QE279_06885, partial [Rhodoferax sp.]|nr:hypothetical protein [Rhodoferax sp.]